MEAIKQSQAAIEKNEGGPFGCVIVHVEKIVGRGNNQVLLQSDPTAHAEIMAIRDACKNLQTHQLTDCEIYTSCEPCPMCLGAIYWARPRIVYYANTRHDAASIGFDDSFIYHEMQKNIDERKIPTENICQAEAFKIFEQWKEQNDKKLY